MAAPVTEAAAHWRVLERIWGGDWLCDVSQKAMHAASTPIASFTSRRVGEDAWAEAPTRLFCRYTPFPSAQYTHLRPYLPGSPSEQRHDGLAATQRSYVATDTLRRQEVLLTPIPKAMASMEHIDYSTRLMRLLLRKVGFQRLLHVYEDQDVWVFVQEYPTNGCELDEYFEAQGCSEEVLKHVVFQVVGLVHFLHAHDLSASGQLVVPEDVMIDSKTHNVLWMVSPWHVLSGAILAQLNPTRRVQDVMHIGYLMLHMCMLRHGSLCSSIDLSDPASVRQLLEDHNQPLSQACSDVIAFCLRKTACDGDSLSQESSLMFPADDRWAVEHPTIHNVSSRKWLRHINFISIVSRLDHGPHDTRRARIDFHALLWKLGTMLTLRWIRALGSAPEAEAPITTEPDQARTQEAAQDRTTKRGQSRRKVFIAGYHPHSAGAIMGGVPMRSRRGFSTASVVGNAMIRAHGSAKITRESGETAAAVSVLSSGTAIAPPSTSQEATQIAQDDATIFELSAHIASESMPEYDIFDYPVPDPLDIDGHHMDDGHVAKQSQRLFSHRPSRSSSRLLYENGHVIDSLDEMQGQIMRSLRQSSRQEDESPLCDPAKSQHLWSEESMDAIYLSAFGPADIARRDSFRIDIWAFLRQQRQEMLEKASEMNESEVGLRTEALRVARGALVTVSIEANEYIGVSGDECKSFRWRGDVNGVSFDLYRKNNKEDEDESLLCIARIVIGVKVSLLYIRLNSSDHRQSSPIGALSTTLEHVLAEVKDIPMSSLEVLHPIGKGAFGEAVLAKWTEENEHVVIKIPHSHVLNDTGAMESFRHEAVVMHMLGKHPHVVELLGLASAGDTNTTGLVMEYMPNGSVRDLLMQEGGIEGNGKTNSLFTRTLMARDAAHGIANIHQGQLLHRDIAARNCLLDENFHVKIADFGLSRWTQQFFFDDDMQSVRPVKWMAPESVFAPHLYSTHSDAYMFGVLLYELFTGKMPFAGLSTPETVALIREGEHVPIPTSLPSTHQKLMQQCLETHPLLRPSMDRIFTTLDHWILEDTRQQNRLAEGLRDL